MLMVVARWPVRSWVCPLRKSSGILKIAVTWHGSCAARNVLCCNDSRDRLASDELNIRVMIGSVSPPVAGKTQPPCACVTAAASRAHRSVPRASAAVPRAPALASRASTAVPRAPALASRASTAVPRAPVLVARASAGVSRAPTTATAVHRVEARAPGPASPVRATVPCASAAASAVPVIAPAVSAGRTAIETSNVPPTLRIIRTDGAGARSAWTQKASKSLRAA